MDIKFIVFSQYPALLLLSLLFLFAYLRSRKRSAVKSVLWVLLFGISLAAAVVLCFLGIQQKYWTLKTLIPFSLWSWIGVGIVAVLELMHIVHSIEKHNSKRRLEKELKRAEEDKEQAVAQAREEGREAARQEAEQARAAEEAARAAQEAAEAEARAAAEAQQAAAEFPAAESADPAEAIPAPEAPAVEAEEDDGTMPKFSLGSLFRKDK